MITGRKIGLAWICLLIATPIIRADWRIETVTDTSKTAKIIDISSSGELKADSLPPIPASTWYALRRPNSPLPELERSPTLFLTNGDCIPCRILDSDGTMLRILPSFLGTTTAKPVSFPLNSVIGWFRNPPTDLEWSELSAKSRNRDLLVNRKGDVLSGSLSAIDDTGFHLKDGAKTTSTERASASSLLLNTDLARIRKLRGRHYRVRLIDGSRLTVPGVAVNSTTLTIKTASNETIDLPIEKLIAINVEQGPVVSLSDLKPGKQDYQTLDGEMRTPRLDLNSFGNPIRLNIPQGESRFARGLGLPGGMTVVYDLSGKYKRFQSTVGMDSRDGRRSELTLKILADGKSLELPEKGKIGLTPIELSLDITGCKTLTIMVTRDRRPGVQEALNLADAWLIP